MDGNGNDAPAIGIDLGTTYSCVAVWKHDRIEIIPNDQGNRTTPSYVAFVDAERLIGDGAKNQAPMNPTNTVFDAKRLIGRRFGDSKVQEDMKLWPFKVIEGPADTPKIVITYRGQEKEFSAEEISSMVLVKMKETAEAYLGKIVKDAVITVPAYFNDSQRQATKDAGTIAGLNEGGSFEVKAVGGDTHLGGEDFDNRMVDHCVAEFKRRWNKDMSENQRAMGRLRFACEKAKRILSCTTRTSVELDCLHEGIDFSLKFTQAKFEYLNMGSFNKCIETLETCLNDAKMQKSCVDQVILVGGSTRIPKVQHMLQDYFDGRELCKSVNADEAVAYGAAVMAAKVSGSNDKSLQTVLLHDVTPLSLGVEVAGEVFDVVIPRNTPIPTHNAQQYHTTYDNQTIIGIKVYQGERSKSTDNHFLGKFDISGIPPARKGVSTVMECFEIDANGILTVTAAIMSTGKTEKLVISKENGRLSKEDIEKMVSDADKFRLEDQEFKKKAKAYNALEDCLYKMKNKIEEYNIKKSLRPSILKEVKKAIEETSIWLEDNQAAPFVELHLKKAHLEFVCKPMF
ncbi:putative Heat shock protein 70 family [Helianthus annuus]|uniref:Heat shock protein 70 family n=1 Tax=Helianthus annuus TaxID=4232 RepID=A0A9K3NGG7_HELAN|nr:putative Heat shock protein 70 family [Helianthus annuus]KAJ0904972.1 putative Heat shock protein 70 family [Helianthus annuus]